MTSPKKSRGYRKSKRSKSSHRRKKSKSTHFKRVRKSKSLRHGYNRMLRGGGAYEDAQTRLKNAKKKLAEVQTKKTSQSRRRKVNTTLSENMKNFQESK